MCDAADNETGYPTNDRRRRQRHHEKPGFNHRLLDVNKVPKYVTDLVIPPVLHDDNGNDADFVISLRQFEQQVLP